MLQRHKQKNNKYLNMKYGSVRSERNDLEMLEEAEMETEDGSVEAGTSLCMYLKHIATAALRLKDVH